jgi:hypothetical protein
MSEPLIVKIPHKLGKEEALRRIKPALGKASSSSPMLVVEEEAPKLPPAARRVSTSWKARTCAHSPPPIIKPTRTIPSTTGLWRRRHHWRAA